MAETVYPEVLWAQRSSATDASKNCIYLTISVPDVPKDDVQLEVKPTGIVFTGTSGTLKKKYHVELQLWGEIDASARHINHTAKNIEMKLIKKELNEEYWPRLLKDSQRVHFLKTDFDKWVDEDEQNEAAEEDLSQFGGMGGMPGMGGNDFGGIDFSKLGGAGMEGLEGMAGMAGGADEGEGDDDDDDDDMPALEGDDSNKDAGKPAAAETTPAAAEKKD